MIMLAVLLLTSGASSLYLKCPNSSGKFPIENSLCKSYYECKNWKVTNEYTCPLRQNFNPVLQRCDYEELYYCAEEGLQKYKRCKKASGKFPKENSFCKTYYQCEKWKVTSEFTCPPGQNFNPAQQWCDWEELYPCLEDKPSTKCPKPSGFFPKPGSQCKSFYHCINGKAHELQCQDDLNFDPVLGHCEWPELSPCEETEGSSTTTLTTRTTRITSTTPQAISSTESTSRGTETEEIIDTTKKYTTAVDETSTETERTTRTKEISKNTEMESTAGTTEDYTFTVEQTSQKETEGPVVIYTTITEEASSETGTKGIGTTPVDTSTITETKESTLLTEQFTTLPTERTSIGTGTGETSGTSEGYTTSVTEETSKLTYSTREFYTTQQTATGGETEETVLSTVSDEKSTTKNPSFTRTSSVTATRGTVSVPTDIPGKLVCPGANGLFPHPTNRHKFLSCLDYVPTVMDCPNDLIYEPTYEACTWDRRPRL